MRPEPVVGEARGGIEQRRQRLDELVERPRPESGLAGCDGELGGDPGGVDGAGGELSRDGRLRPGRREKRRRGVDRDARRLAGERRDEALVGLEQRLERRALVHHQVDVAGQAES